MPEISAVGQLTKEETKCQMSDGRRKRAFSLFSEEGECIGMYQYKHHSWSFLILLFSCVPEENPLKASKICTCCT